MPTIDEHFMSHVKDMQSMVLPLRRADMQALQTQGDMRLA